jgi:hypothetical protein
VASVYRELAARSQLLSIFEAHDILENRLPKIGMQVSSIHCGELIPCNSKYLKEERIPNLTGTFKNP